MKAASCSTRPRAPYLFLAPFIATFVLSLAYPLVQSLWLAFQQTSGPQHSRFVGFEGKTQFNVVPHANCFQSAALGREPDFFCQLDEAEAKLNGRRSCRPNLIGRKSTLATLRTRGHVRLDSLLPVTNVSRPETDWNSGDSLLISLILA